MNYRVYPRPEPVSVSGGASDIDQADLIVNSEGQTVFSLQNIPVNSIVVFAINGVGVSKTHYSVNGTSLTYSGPLTLKTSDEITVTHLV